MTMILNRLETKPMNGQYVLPPFLKSLQVGGMILCLIFCPSTSYAISQVKNIVPQTVSQGLSSQEEEQIFVQTKTSTWMPRGRNLLDVGPLVRDKLSSIGFLVKTDELDPRMLSLNVDYQEDRGIQYTLDSFGTNISCEIELTHPTSGTLWKETVQESSGAQTFGTPPYIVALQKFQTNPYIYFLGDIVKGQAIEGLDISQSLMKGFRRVLRAEKGAVDPLLNPHSMLEAESSYALRAQAKTLQELGRIKNPHAVPFLIEMLNHAESNLRVLSVRALGSIGSKKARTALQQASKGHEDELVRTEAAAALAKLPPLTPS